EWDMKMIENKTPYAAIQYIRKSIGNDEFLKEYALYRQMNYEEIKEVLDEIQERSKDFKNIPEWFTHVENYKKVLKLREKNGRVEEGIHLITMHGAKGLEFDTVFVIAANEGVTPYKKAKTIDEIEEERRLFYVAMTRAKKQLTISYVKEKNGKDATPSRFVNELFFVK
ncbi:MAG: 3'-5' exonuclease, partial [Dorea sp.]